MVVATPFTIRRQPPHNFILFNTVYDGILATCVLVILFVDIFHQSWKKNRPWLTARTEKLATLRLAVWLGLFARILLYGQLTYLTWSPGHNIDLFLTLGFLWKLCLDQSVEDSRSSASVSQVRR
jgi:hypothetical protein